MFGAAPVSEDNVDGQQIWRANSFCRRMCFPMFPDVSRPVSEHVLETRNVCAFFLMHDEPGRDDLPVGHWCRWCIPDLDEWKYCRTPLYESQTFSWLLNMVLSCQFLSKPNERRPTGDGSWSHKLGSFFVVKPIHFVNQFLTMF